MTADLPEGRLLELVNLAIDAYGSRLVKVLCARHRGDKLALARALAAAAGVGIEQAVRAHRDRDQITILTGRGRATKLITPTGIGDYAAGTWFGMTTAGIGNIAELAGINATLEREAPYSFLIRAKLIEGRDPKRVRRLLYPDPRTGEAPYFEPCPRHWCGLDFDSFALPPGVGSVDLEAVAALAVARLPEPFRRASRWAQLTSGAGVKPGGRVRLFYWLDRPTSGAELKRWLKPVPGLDTSTLNDVTPNYVAKPLFVGVRDPVPIRSKLIASEVDAVIVPDLPEPKQPKPCPAEAQDYSRPERGLGFRSTRSERYMIACLHAIAEAEVGARHPSIVRVATRLYGLAKAGALDPHDVEARVRGAVNLSTFDRDPAEVDAALQWAWDHAEPWRLP